MKFSTFSALALATAPPMAQAWSFGPLLFPGDTMLLQPPTSMLARQRALANRMFHQMDEQFQAANKLATFSSPRYDLIDDETKFQLSVDVPGVKMEDIDISLEDGYLSVRGQRVVVSGDENDDENSSGVKSRFSSKFSQTFALDPSIIVDEFSATLDNGVLVVTAPKDMKKLEENVKKIPIMAGSSTPTSKVISGAPDSKVKEDIDKDTIDLDKVEAKKEEKEHVKV